MFHSHYERLSRKVNALGQVGEELMVERLNPVGITTLYNIRVCYTNNTFLILTEQKALA